MKYQKTIKPAPLSFIYARLYLMPRELVLKLLMLKGLKEDGYQERFEIKLIKDEHGGNARLI